jgi:ATP:ADP antiporter, AAA family
MEAPDGWKLTRSSLMQVFVGQPYLQKQKKEVVGLAPLPHRLAASAGDAGASNSAEGKFLGTAWSTWKKILPLGFMFFCILFNYTILRDTKVCTAVVNIVVGRRIVDDE